MNRYNKEACYARLLNTGASINTIEVFRREPYHLTAARREKGIRLDDYSARGEKAVTDESRESE